MADTGKGIDSLRLNRFDFERLSFVLAFSLAAHLVIYGGYEAGKTLKLLPAHLFAKKPTPIPIVQNNSQPIEFAMVQNPSAEAPKNAKYYGAQNSQAADDTHKNQDEAKIDGTQTEIIKTEDATRDFNKLQPTQQPHPETKNVPTVDPGDLTFGKKQTPQPQTKPQKLSQVKPHTTPGLKMLQNGGAARLAAPALDVKSSLTGTYDQAFVEAVSQRWYDLLDSQNFALDRTGKVVVRFHLNYDGTITDMTVLQNTVGELLGTVCQDAIHDPAPFAQWSPEMRQQIGQTYREITFTFYYY
jgi:hypothetical protein